MSLGPIMLRRKLIVHDRIASVGYLETDETVTKKKNASNKNEKSRELGTTG